jgi:hypothetical protein
LGGGLIVLDGVMLLWFILTALSLLFVAIDIRSTPESPVMKWAFVLLTAYTGPFGAFFYVLGCREPLPGMHEAYTAARWRQVLGSTMHCVAGDGVGILAGAAIGSVLALSGLADILMAAMLPLAALGRLLIGTMLAPRMPEFWFVMSLALFGGFLVAYPMNWWLVSHGLKHGMMTVRRGVPSMPMSMPMPAQAQSGHAAAPVTRGELAGMAILSIVLFALGAGIALRLGVM